MTLWTIQSFHRIRNPLKLLIFVKRDTILLLHLDELFLLLLLIELLAHLGLLIVENDEIPIGDVEAREVVDGGFCVVDVLVDDKGRAASILVGADSDLADGTVLAEDVVHLFAGDVEWQVADVENSVHLRRQPRVAFSK